MDDSGLLDRQEFIALCARVDPSMTKAVVDETFIRIDTDHSGEISKDEFEQWWIKGAPQQPGGANTPSVRVHVLTTNNTICARSHYITY